MRNLHKDLQLDAAEKGKLLVSPDLPTFTDKYIVPYLISRKDFAVLVQNNKVNGLNMKEVSERYMDTLVEALEESPEALIGNPEAYDPEVDVIEISDNFSVTQASEISKNLLLVVFEFQALAYFTYFLTHSEYATLSDEELGGIAVVEPNWNEHVMQVEAGETVNYTCRLTFDPYKQEVESFEVESVT